MYVCARSNPPICLHIVMCLQSACIVPDIHIQRPTRLQSSQFPPINPYASYINTVTHSLVHTLAAASCIHKFMVLVLLGKVCGYFSMTRSRQLWGGPQ